jgi:hypothetical protein
MPDEDEIQREAVRAAEERRAALTAETTTDDPEAATRHARQQAPRGRTDRPSNTAG